MEAESTSPEPNLLQQFLSHDAHPVFQVAKYLIFGVVTVAVHMTVFYLLASGSLFPALDNSLVDGQPISDALRARNSTINNGIAWFFGNATAYTLNVLWVFKPGRHNKATEMALFTLVNLIAFLGGLFGGPLLIKLLGVSTHLSQGTYVLSSMIVNFVCRKFFIFKG